MLSQSSQETRQKFMLEFSKEILTQVAKKLPKEILEERSIETIIKKLEEILHEEGVEAIECPAPDRYLLVKKNGKLKILNMMLEEKEIDGIIKHYFNKAGKGFFNPFSIYLSGMRIVGLLSSRIGSRFVIFKKKFYS